MNWIAVYKIGVEFLEREADGAEAVGKLVDQRRERGLGDKQVRVARPEETKSVRFQSWKAGRESDGVTALAHWLRSGVGQSGVGATSPGVYTSTVFSGSSNERLRSIHRTGGQEVK